MYKSLIYKSFNCNLNCMEVWIINLFFQKQPLTVSKSLLKKKKEPVPEDDEDSNILDYEEESDYEQEEECPVPTTSGIWSEGGWRIDPRKEGKSFTNLRKPQLRLPCPETQTELGFLLHFLPIKYFEEIMLPEMDINISIDEFLHFLGLIYFMETVKLPERRMYWITEDKGVFKAPNFGKFMTRFRFEEILHKLKFSQHEDPNEQINEFLDAVNNHLKTAMTPSDVIVLDESMIKSYHKNLQGKMKIMRKPRPIGNELKNVCCGFSKIVLHLELYRGKEIMQHAEHVRELGATTACCLRMTKAWSYSGKIVVADSWFGSVKSAVNLLNRNGLHSIMLVKTAHRDYPKDLLATPNRGEWNSATATIDDVDLLAVKFMDLQEKQFISTCSTSSVGPPRQTKHHGEVPRPQIAYDYLSYAAGIDIHNHVRTGSLGFEDVWSTKSPQHRQFAGIIGFLFSNAYLAQKYFKPNSRMLKHADFKLKLANQLIEYTPIHMSRAASASSSSVSLNSSLNESIISPAEHTILKYEGSRQQRCFVCQNHFREAKVNKTTYYCEECRFAICKPTSSRNCWQLHLKEKIVKKYRK